MKRWLWLIPILGLLALAGVALWAATPPAPMPEALAALESDERAQVSVKPWLAFQPAGAAPTVGFIFYPGGRVDVRSYAPAARAIAEAGYLAVIVPMPLNLAIIAPGRAADVMAAYPGIERWAVGGHSLGGAMAARFAYQNPSAAQGLVLWAAYPAATDDLSRSGLAVISISGTLDGLSTPDKIAASRPLLPADTVWAAIEDGNHAQFGWYGEQSGDNPASISRESQQAQVVAATLSLLARLGP
jgi:hypothetical protein